MLAKFFTWSPVILLGIIFFSSCEQSREIGFDLVPREQAGVIFSDTFALEVSTVLGEIRTSDASRYLVGQYLDPDFGEVSAQSYFQLVRDTLSLVLEEGASARYDSIVFELNADYFYGNSEASQTFTIHQVTEEGGIRSTDSDFRYTSQSTVAFESASIASFTRTQTELQDSPFVRLKLGDALGQRIFDLAEAGTSRADFLEEFKGFTIQSSANPGEDFYIMGISTSVFTRVAVYYTEIDADNNELTRTLSFIPTGANRFNNIRSDRSGIPDLAGLDQPLDEISVLGPDSIAYVQAGVGLQTKISFPSLKEYYDSKNIAINRAELLIKPVPGGTDFFTEPGGLILFETDASNAVAQFESEGNTFDLLVQEEGTNPFGFNSPLIINYGPRDEQFLAEITSHLGLILSDRKSNPSLLIAPSNQGNNVNRLQINGKQSSPFSMKLRVYYTIFE